MTDRSAICAATLAALLLLLAPQGTTAGEADAAYADIGETYGTVPGFFRLFAEDDIADVWFEFRTLQLNPYIVMDAKTRELIGVGVAAQGPCRACVYFHAAAALANGATQEEIREAVGVGAATRRLDAAFSNAGVDLDTFKHETNLVLWGDARAVELHGPPAGFCDFIMAWADADYVGC